MKTHKNQLKKKKKLFNLTSFSQIFSRKLSYPLPSTTTQVYTLHISVTKQITPTHFNKILHQPASNHFLEQITRTSVNIN